MATGALRFARKTVLAVLDTFRQNLERENLCAGDGLFFGTAIFHHARQPGISAIQRPSSSRSISKVTFMTTSPIDSKRRQRNSSLFPAFRSASCGLRVLFIPSSQKTFDAKVFVDVRPVDTLALSQQLVELVSKMLRSPIRR
jgi:ectoine hydroxylase-related dioxygenase (phytanoyl-CoA dioxygenase family)